jgi:hypothetical protein
MFILLGHLKCEQQRFVLVLQPRQSNGHDFGFVCCVHFLIGVSLTAFLTLSNS